jgi:hypothetical protein
MRRLNTRAPRIAGLLALMLGAVALLAVTGIAAAKDRGADDNGGHHAADDNGQHHGRHHDHGRHHGRHFKMREAGTISSFDASTGKLTIALLDGGTVTGLVTEGTEIKCEGVDDRRARRDHGGRGEAEPGDDHGGHRGPGRDDSRADSSGPGSSGSGHSGSGDSGTEHSGSGSSGSGSGGSGSGGSDDGGHHSGDDKGSGGHGSDD